MSRGPILRPAIPYHRNVDVTRCDKIHYEYVQQPELLELCKTTLLKSLEPYKNRDDVEILILGPGKLEHPVDSPDCLSINIKIMVKPRKELKVNE